MTYEDFKNTFSIPSLILLQVKFLESLENYLSDNQKILYAFMFLREREGHVMLSKNDLPQKIHNFCENFKAIQNTQEETDENKSNSLEQELLTALENAFCENNVFEKIAEKQDKSYEGKKPFIQEGNNLFIQKYYAAKLIIEKKMKEIFQSTNLLKQGVSDSAKNANNEKKGNSKSKKNATQNEQKPNEKNSPKNEDNTEEKNEDPRITKVKNDISAILKEPKSFQLKTAQAEAIFRGQTESLMITGGPGTGKTTVVFYILRSLLLNKEFENSPIYLMAPSGKAADRMQESLAGSFRFLSPEEEQKNKKVYDRIRELKGATIHRSLKYNASKAQFSVNKENPFHEKSIIIVDEASMVDIELFAQLLNAIPEDARVFLLGDKDQLPSVDAGAVLGELLARKETSVVELTESNRFPADSTLGQMAKAINEGNTTAFKEIFDPKENKPKPSQVFLNKNDWDLKSLQNDLKEIWECDLQNLKKLIKEIKVPETEEVSKEDDETLFQKCETLWQLTTQVKVLCAERYAVDAINKLIAQNLGSVRNPFNAIYMLNKNQNDLGLYNGDTAILIQEIEGKQKIKVSQKNEGKQKKEENPVIPYFMFKKGEKFVFYRKSKFATDNISVAYAITIHKSQGSEFKNVWMILPKKVNHPLNNRQIIYTGITRTKITKDENGVESGSCHIIASQEVLNSAISKKLERDTGINLQD